MIARIAPIAVQRLGRAEGTAARALVQVEPVAATEREPADRARPRASEVAMAPAAMSALIEAQEHMAGEAAVIDRSITAEKIDHILARLAAVPPARPITQAVDAGFSVQMLMAAREQLRETFA